ncbi:Ig-like domain-containing protein [Streptococcus ovis]|uniref:Ig-like domain-containing protein n=1 Tax=Streptococcus ovis TaxID=82806 RepID=UPI0003695B7C|nr:Ig-like domain-containing protein [Streptococcus ovis]
MDKIKNIIGFLLLSIVFVFGTYFTKTDTVSADEHNNTIVKMYITDRNGKELTPPEIDQWQQFRINADFDLTNSDVKKGDTTVVTIPKVIQFVGTKTFELRDTDGNLVANGEVISGSQIKITYTDLIVRIPYPELRLGVFLCKKKTNRFIPVSFLNIYDNEVNTILQLLFDQQCDQR